jgi:hypothetical protein
MSMASPPVSLGAVHRPSSRLSRRRSTSNTRLPASRFLPGRKTLSDTTDVLPESARESAAPAAPATPAGRVSSAGPVSSLSSADAANRPMELSTPVSNGASRSAEPVAGPGASTEAVSTSTSSARRRRRWHRFVCDAPTGTSTPGFVPGYPGRRPPPQRSVDRCDPERPEWCERRPGSRRAGDGCDRSGNPARVGRRRYRHNGRRAAQPQPAGPPHAARSPP